jgi:hypothetical protein
VILQRLRVDSFRALEALEVRFGPGLNVVRGPNEAGKSTLQAAIVAVLFADPHSRTRATEAMKPWGLDTFPALTAEIASPGQEYSVTKDFEARRAEVLLPDGKRLTDRAGVAEAMGRLTQIGDEASYRATACLVQQQWAQISAGAELQELVQQSLTGGIEGLAVGDILAKLDRSIADLERGSKRQAPKNPGELTATIARREAVERELARARADYATRTRAQAELELGRNALSDTTARLEQAENLRSRAERYIRLDREVSELRRNADRLGGRLVRVQRLGLEIEALRNGLEEAPAVDREMAQDVATWADRQRDRISELHALRRQEALLDNECKQLQAEARKTAGTEIGPDTVHRATELKRQAEEARERAGRHLAQAQDYSERTESIRRHLAPRKYLLTIGVLSIVLGAVAATEHLLGLGACALGTALVIAALLRRAPADLRELPRKIETAQKAHRADIESSRDKTTELRRLLADLLPDEPVDLDRGVAELAELAARRARDTAEGHAVLHARQEALKDLRTRIGRTDDLIASLQRRLEAVLRETSLESVEDLIEQAETRESALRDLGERESQREGLLDGETEEQMADGHRKLLLDVRAREYEMESPELATARLSPRQYEELLAEIAGLREQSETLVAKIRQAEIAVATAGSDADAVNVLEGQLDRLVERETVLRERLEVRRIARDVLHQARQETFSEAGDLLEPKMSELLSQLTGRRYVDVRLDSDMRPVVAAPGHGHEIAADDLHAVPDLSCATREQVFLAARLAIINMLWPEGGPPVLLDDPLVNFDPERSQAALEAVRDLAQVHQVILFTCSHDYDRWADHVVELAGPEGR